MAIAAPGQPFVVENRPGAGSTIGIASVVGSPADGYTLLLVSTSAVISAAYYKNLSFEIIRDIAPVCGISLEPLVMVVNPAVPAKTVREFIAYAKANPGKIVMASVGNGTTPQYPSPSSCRARMVSISSSYRRSQSVRQLKGGAGTPPLAVTSSGDVQMTTDQ